MKTRAEMRAATDAAERVMHMMRLVGDERRYMLAWSAWTDLMADEIEMIGCDCTADICMLRDSLAWRAGTVAGMRFAAAENRVDSERLESPR